MKISQIITESHVTCPHCGGPAYSDPMLAEKKDACYHKVKASAKVWPSAYASGRLVQCRKKGAANYGNKSEGVAEGSQEINWVKPNFDFEWHEVEEQSRMKQVPVDVRQYYQKHFPNKDAWLKAVQNGKAVVVPPDHAYEIRNAPFDKASLQKVLAPTGHEGPIGPAKEKRVNDLFDKGQVEMPIILKTSQGLWLIGGKTRLGTANYVKGLPAKVWLIGGEQGMAEGGAETSWSNNTDTITLQDILELTKHIKQINLPINDNLKSKLLHWEGNPEEIERVNPDVVYLYEIRSWLGKIANGNNQEDWIEDTLYSVRYEFLKH